jgi:hypothetical protein
MNAQFIDAFALPDPFRDQCNPAQDRSDIRRCSGAVWPMMPPTVELSNEV